MPNNRRLSSAPQPRRRLSDGTRLCRWAVVAMAVAQVALFPLSWLVAAVAPDARLHSLLSSEGIRWFFGRFTHNMAHPLLVWLLLAVVAIHALRQSGLMSTLRSLRRGARLTLPRRSGIRAAALVVLVAVAVMAALTCAPDAPLVGLTGRPFPLGFPAAIVPVLAFTLFAAGAAFAFAAGQTRQLLQPSTNHLPLILLLYILAMQLYQSLLFVLGLWF